ncbi:Bro-N domain-containing protein [Patescibacteria group bacterium]|nr:Bro-N domain-containing protein [Patescibacteria group bacterium]
MNNNEVDKNNKIALFEKKEIRKIWHNNEWYFSVVDVVGILTDSLNYQSSRKYWNKLSQRLHEENSEVVTKCHQLKLLATDGKMRLTDCANTEGILRIIQSIPSPKAEPFKRWLAKVGYERIEEIENPELAQKRMKKIYEAKGYPEDWIDKRIRGISIRQNLTDEWRNRGFSNPSDYSILTAEISKATFGMTPSEYKKLKNIPEKSKINLRDNMTDLELIFTMLGERVTTEISKKEEPDGMVENKKVAKRGGKVAGDARKGTEKEIGDTIINKGNYLN